MPALRVSFSPLLERARVCSPGEAARSPWRPVPARRGAVAVQDQRSAVLAGQRAPIQLHVPDPEIGAGGVGQDQPLAVEPQLQAVPRPLADAVLAVGPGVQGPRVHLFAAQEPN